MQENQLGRREFNYRGSSLPISPSEGQTWREIDVNGKWVADWIRSGSSWLSSRGDTFSNHVAIPDNAGTIDCPTGINAGTWAFRAAGRLAAGGSADVWRIQVRQATIAVTSISYSTQQTFFSAEGLLWTFDTGWMVLSDTAWIVGLFTKMSGPGASLNGVIEVEKRRIRT